MKADPEKRLATGGSAGNDPDLQNLDESTQRLRRVAAWLPRFQNSCGLLQRML